jgi:hypothetical protein
VGSTFYPRSTGNYPLTFSKISRLHNVPEPSGTPLPT